MTADQETELLYVLFKKHHFEPLTKPLLKVNEANTSLTFYPKE